MWPDNVSVREENAATLEVMSRFAVDCIHHGLRPTDGRRTVLCHADGLYFPDSGRITSATTVASTKASRAMNAAP